MCIISNFTGIIDSVANLAALECVKFCCLTCVILKNRFLSERTRTREINWVFLTTHNYRDSRVFAK